MEPGAKWQVITEQRLALADLLADLDDESWERPSLCEQWRVKDVAAHVALTPQSPGLPVILGKALRVGFHFDRLNRDLAVAHADRPPSQIVDLLRTLADSRRKPAITTLDNLLFDTLVHVQDVAVPLGVEVVPPVEGTREGAVPPSRPSHPQSSPYGAVRVRRREHPGPPRAVASVRRSVASQPCSGQSCKDSTSAATPQRLPGPGAGR